MTTGELELLHRAHRLFAGVPQSADRELSRAGAQPYSSPFGVSAAYRAAAATRRGELAAARGVDGELATVLRAVRDDHREARRQTGAVLEAARADTGSAPDNPLAHRELLRRRAARLRSQHGHVQAARRRARRRLIAMLALRYRDGRRRLPAPSSGAAIAVRAALSRLGCPYVWGATGPDRFDCSGLVTWAYAQAGIGLQRTTYQQIHDGVAVPRSAVRPGDLVFPHAGHVQLAIGGNLVVEAPHAGATVRISPLGNDVVIRRPL